MKKAIHTDEYRVFLDVLKEVRDRANLTQEDVATRLGATQSYVSKCERGERRLDIVQLNSYCEALGIGLSAFVRHVEKAWERS